MKIIFLSLLFLVNSVWGQSKSKLLSEHFGIASIEQPLSRVFVEQQRAALITKNFCVGHFSSELIRKKVILFVDPTSMEELYLNRINLSKTHIILYIDFVKTSCELIQQTYMQAKRLAREQNKPIIIVVKNINWYSECSKNSDDMLREKNQLKVLKRCMVEQEQDPFIATFCYFAKYTRTFDKEITSYFKPDIYVQHMHFPNSEDWENRLEQEPDFFERELFHEISGSEVSAENEAIKFINNRTWKRKLLDSLYHFDNSYPLLSLCIQVLVVVYIPFILFMYYLKSHKKQNKKSVNNFCEQDNMITIEVPINAQND